MERSASALVRRASTVSSGSPDRASSVRRVSSWRPVAGSFAQVGGVRRCAASARATALWLIEAGSMPAARRALPSCPSAARARS